MASKPRELAPPASSSARPLQSRKQGLTLQEQRLSDAAADTAAMLLPPSAAAAAAAAAAPSPMPALPPLPPAFHACGNLDGMRRAAQLTPPPTVPPPSPLLLTPAPARWPSRWQTLEQVHHVPLYSQRKGACCRRPLPRQHNAGLPTQLRCPSCCRPAAADLGLPAQGRLLILPQQPCQSGV